MTNNQKIAFALIVSFIFSLSSCTGYLKKKTTSKEISSERMTMESRDESEDSHDHTAEDDHNHGADGEDAHQEGAIHLTVEQISTMGITLGSLSNLKINDYVSTTGTLGLPPNAYSAVSAKANGFIVDSRKYVEGNYIKKGVIMAYLENPEFIQHQQDYLEVKAELQFLTLELARQKTLLKANAGIEKTVQKLESEVNMKTATQNGIAKRLQYLGIDTDEISTENMVQKVPVISPMSGYITSIKMHNGIYVEPNMELMEIVDENHLHLELDVFEKDISAIKEEQKITYTVPALGNTIYEGEVHVLGKEFNTENKTVRIHGHLGKDHPQFIKDLFIEAKIWINDQTVQAVPEQAVMKDGDYSYIYVADEIGPEEKEVKFIPIKVIPGTSDKGYVAIKLLENMPVGMKIVTEGAFYVYAQSKAGELTHEH